VSVEATVPTLNTVTEGRVTYTANESVESIREQAGLEAEKPETPDKPATEKPTESTPDTARDESGKFVAKPKADEKVDEKPDKFGGDPRQSIQAKLNRATQLQRDAERKASEAERERDELRTKLAATAPKPADVGVGTTAPVPAESLSPTLQDRLANPLNYPAIESDSDFWKEYPEASIADLARYTARYEQFSILREREQRQSVEQAHQTRVQSIGQAGAERYPEWDDLIAGAPDLRLPAVVLDEINSLEDPTLSADILHHILTHPEYAATLDGVRHPIAAAREIARVSVGLSAAHSGPATAPARQTKAKPLIKPVGASPAAPEASPPDALPFGRKYIDEMNAKERKEREARRGA
jgi:hypothetical protein